MAQLFGQSYTRSELLERVGDISQIVRVKPYRLVEGFEDGVLALDVVNGSGLDFTVLASRGMDISTARYNGRPLNWRSPTTDAHPAYFDTEGEAGRGWLRSFYGGLVVTCGLSYAGANGEDRGRLYGLHGRASNLPASNVHWEGAWEGDEYVLTVRGSMREATVFGENIALRRTIMTRMGEPRLIIHDVVENMGAQPAEHMMLYHVNIGFPAVGDNGKLIATSRRGVPRDADAEEGRDRLFDLQPPESGYREKVYFHDMVAGDDGRAMAAIVNAECDCGSGSPGFGVYCAFDPAQLPRFIEWKMMDAGTYVVGMEPANCLVMGRARERSMGTLQSLRPGEQREYDVEIGVLAGSAQIDRFDTACRQTVASARGSSAD